MNRKGRRGLLQRMVLRARTHSRCYASFYSPHKHVSRHAHTRTHTRRHTHTQSPWVNIVAAPPAGTWGDFSPKPTSEDHGAFKLGRREETKVRSQQRHFKEICPADQASTKTRREVGVCGVQHHIPPQSHKPSGWLFSFVDRPKHARLGGDYLHESISYW